MTMMAEFTDKMNGNLWEKTMAKNSMDNKSIMANKSMGKK